MYLHRRAMALILLAFVCTARAEVTPTLNSDAIEAAFGTYGVEVIDQGLGTRVANLFSGRDSEKVCRTLAVTEFVQPINSALLASHQEIIDGNSIGATLRSAGFTINKKLLIKTEIPATAAFIALARGTVGEGQNLFTKVYALYAETRHVSLPYAVIAEAYHPAHYPPVHEEVTEIADLKEAAQRALKTLQRFRLKEGLKTPAA